MGVRRVNYKMTQMKSWIYRYFSVVVDKNAMTLGKPE